MPNRVVRVDVGRLPQERGVANGGSQEARNERRIGRMKLTVSNKRLEEES